MTHVKDLYEPRIARARAMVGEARIVERLLAPDIDARLLLRFLIEYCAHGVGVTEPVDGWITRAGQACARQPGLQALGEALAAHARHEAGHHVMFIEDTRKLVARWNAAGHPALDADALLARPPTVAMRRYTELHEATIAGELPAAQVAIELEIERLSVVLLPDLLAQFRRVLGDDVLDGLSFLTSHAELDVGHTHLNTRLMETLLAARPEAAGDLARVGGEAMFIYLAFFDECLALAEGACAGPARQPPRTAVG